MATSVRGGRRVAVDTAGPQGEEARGPGVLARSRASRVSRPRVSTPPPPEALVQGLAFEFLMSSAGGTWPWILGCGQEPGRGSLTPWTPLTPLTPPTREQWL